MDPVKEGGFKEIVHHTFARLQELRDRQAVLVNVNLEAQPTDAEDELEREANDKLTVLFAEYQEQPYLIDPFLEELINPLAAKLKLCATQSISGKSLAIWRVNRLSSLAYSYVKFRGYKTIIRFLPHEVGDLTLILDFLLLPDGIAQQTWQWSVRYIFLLWLSLVCRIPFDFALFDPENAPGSTADTIEAIGKKYIGYAGVERSGAAYFLSRVYMRSDCLARFSTFMQESREILPDSIDPCVLAGILQVLCEVAKSAPDEQLQGHLPDLIITVNTAAQNDTLMANSMCHKLQIKLLTRCALRMLPAPRLGLRRGKALMGVEVDATDLAHNDIEVPEEVEGMIGELFEAVQDKETIVRWSAAKGIARVAERLPRDFAEQVLDTTLSLFAIHLPAAMAMGDLPPIAEATWHGASLTCAELARRGLIPEIRLPELMTWLLKGIYFDIRKGAHSIGSSVRDATAYVLWSLARAQSPDALKPHANTLARHLVTVSLFDREVHIRRAASAAFQEYVGRTSLFPHGIDVLGKADFFSVGVRRNAFLAAAPAVAGHAVYRDFLVEHLLAVVLRHWDPAMRQLGAESLRAICEIDLHTIGIQSASRAVRLLETSDTSDINGGLLALTEISKAYRRLGEAGETYLRTIFSHLKAAPLQMILAPRNAMLTESACRLIAASITRDEVLYSGPGTPPWRQIVECGLKHRSPSVQEAGAAAMASVSNLADCSYIADFRKAAPVIQQSLARLLGAVNYCNMPQDALEAAVNCLLESVDKSSPHYMANVEARRNCFQSMPLITSNVISTQPTRLTPHQVQLLFDALLGGLNDYSTDERGDVGSWIRMAVIEGLTTFSGLLMSCSTALTNLEEYLPSGKYHTAVGGILKQGVERLDNVRQYAGEHFIKLLGLQAPKVPGGEAWRIEGQEVFVKLFQSEDQSGWNNSAWLYPKAVECLNIRRYRTTLLEGLILSIASKTDSTQRPASASIIKYVQSLHTLSVDEQDYDLVGLARDLYEKANENAGSNAIVIPRLQTFVVLLEGEALDSLTEVPEGTETLRKWLSFATRNIARLKNVQRIQLSMKIVVSLLPFGELYAAVVPHLEALLAHPFPKIRADTAEALFLILQTKDVDRETDEVEDVLLETEWSKSDITTAQEAARRVVALLGPDPK